MAAEADCCPKIDAEETFKKIDADGDGLISMEEAVEMVKTLGLQVGEDVVAKFFDDADADKDGKISFDEFKKILEREA